MKQKNLMIGIAVLLVVAVSAGVFLKSARNKPVPAEKVIAEKEMKPAVKAEPVIKKTFSKDMGGLTIKMISAKNKQLFLRVRPFRSVGPKTGVYFGSFTVNRMQELLPGTYDVELDTIPQMIRKGLVVSKGAETTENLGCITGILNVKVMNAAGKEASYPIKIYHAKTSTIVMTTAAGRPVELLSGAYDVEVGVLPKVIETAVNIEPGKERILDLGTITGTIVIKVVDQDKIEKKDARYSVKIKKNDTGEPVSNARVNKPVELRQGSYAIEIATNPVQSKKDVKVNPGEEIVVEFVVEAPIAPAPLKPAAAARPIPAEPVKGK